LTRVASGSCRWERGEHVRELRIPPVTLLGEHQLVVDEDVELAVLALDHLGRGAGAVQLGHETRGPLVVALSDGAVEDADVRHGAMLAVAAGHALDEPSGVDLSAGREDGERALQFSMPVA